MKQNLESQESKKLLRRIKKMMKENEMRWKDVGDFFGFESHSTVANWFSKEMIPKNQHKFVDLFLQGKKY